MSLFHSTNLFHSCRRAAELISQELDEPLAIGDRWRLKIHLKMCGNCREVEKQLAMLHELAPDLGAFDEDLTEKRGQAPAP